MDDAIQSITDCTEESKVPHLLKALARNDKAIKSALAASGGAAAVGSMNCRTQSAGVAYILYDDASITQDLH